MSASHGPVPGIRPRRTRGTAAWRRLVAQTRLHPAELVLPMFVREGVSAPVPISSMPGVHQHTLDSLKRALREAADAGIGGVMLFGVPEHKDATGSGAWTSSPITVTAACSIPPVGSTTTRASSATARWRSPRPSRARPCWGSRA